MKINTRRFQTLLSDPIILAFLLSTLFLIYLVFTAQMIVVQDAIAFEQNGAMVYKQGWLEYFRTGPNREPFAALTIAFSMRLADHWHVSYQDIQKIIQLIFLILAQLLAWKLLYKLRVNRYLTAAVILSLGFLPAMANSVVTLYSEVFTYPLVLGIILTTGTALKVVREPFSRRLIAWAALLGFLFMWLTLTKAVVEILTPPFLFMFIVWSLAAFIRKNYPLARNYVIFAVVAGLIFFVPVYLFKSMNYKHNGKFAVTNRGAFMLYGNTMRHMEKFSLERVLVGVACSMGSSHQTLCHKLFGEEACAFWDFRTSDAHAHDKIGELTLQGMPPGEIDKTLVRLAIQEIIKHPVQYTAFAASEALTMIFFKAAEVTYVAYPDWLERIYNSIVLQYIINFLSASLTFVALIYTGWFFGTRCRPMILHSEKADETFLYLWPAYVFVWLFIGLHALISVQTRYCLPIASLYLILIVFMISNIGKLTKRKN